MLHHGRARLRSAVSRCSSCHAQVHMEAHRRLCSSLLRYSRHSTEAAAPSQHRWVLPLFFNRIFDPSVFFLSVIVEVMARDPEGINGCVCLFSLARAVYKRGVELRSSERFQHDCHPPQGGPPHRGGQQTNRGAGGTHGNSAHRREDHHCWKVLLIIIGSTFTLTGTLDVITD